MEPETADLTETLARPRRKRLGLITGVIVAALAAAGAGVYLLWPRQVMVPDLGGSSFANAVMRLQSGHLLVGRETVKGNAAQATMVVGQSPAPGTSVASGSKIDLVLSAMVVVPALVGKSLNTVERTLSGENLVLGNLQWDQRSRVRRNTVLQQVPAAGQNVPAGTTVSLTLSGMPDRSGQAAVNSVQPASASGQNVNLSGVWRDPVGSRVQILQSGSNLRYSARNVFGNCQGNGVMNGQNFQTFYTCVSVVGIRSNGRCAGTVAASGNAFRLQCLDSITGRTNGNFTR
jgi:beta-lactam-binding protein with PASTA domain